VFKSVCLYCRHDSAVAEKSGDDTGSEYQRAFTEEQAMESRVQDITVRAKAVCPAGEKNGRVM
jgi:hypothetical protein